MKNFLPKNLIKLSSLLPQPIYVVGGFVRNFLISGKASSDIDLASPMCVEDILPSLSLCDFKIVSQFKRTGTLVFFDGQRKYEFTSFRKEEYLGGEHTPYKTTFTGDILEDALRRDFKCNAVYFDIKNNKFVDPLGGINDIKNKVLDTVRNPKAVFSNDGLRLMRLARFSGQLNFKPTPLVLEGAFEFRNNIKEISVERIHAELEMILHADKAYPFSPKTGHYDALKILDKTGVLDLILPELSAGRGMVQRADYHLYDVLEHSLKSVLYADESVRLAMLLHDVGKPECLKRNGNFYNHDSVGEAIADSILKRLKVATKTLVQVKFLIREHMRDIDCKMKERKVRKFIAKNSQNFTSLMKVKQADYKASKEQDGIAPTVEKWQKIYEKMRVDGTPFALNEVKILSKDLMDIGFKENMVGEERKKLFELCVLSPEKNVRDSLIKIAKQDFIKSKHKDMKNN